MAYTTINKSTDYFNTKLYTGNSTDNHAITGVGFAPDFTWIKNRANAYDNMLFDALRGTGSLRENLRSNTTDASDNDASNLKTLNSDGFTLGTGGYVNHASTFASWNWKANGAGSSNTDGSITSTVSANTTSGFSIVKWTGTGSNATVGHGLGTAPTVILAKNLAASQNWRCLFLASGDANGYFSLNTSDARDTSSTVWQGTSPTNTVFSTGTAFSANDYIAYCFAEKKGFSKFGSYVANGNADGAFCYTGFSPSFILIKSATTAMYWHIFDNKRQGFNPNNYRLNPNANEVETTTTGVIDFLSNGFKIRTSQQQFGTSGATYIYMAFAEAPLVGSNNVPATAR